MARKIAYTEPMDYIPKNVRKELKIGEFAPKEKAAAPAKKAPASKKKK